MVILIVATRRKRNRNSVVLFIIYVIFKDTELTMFVRGSISSSTRTIEQVPELTYIQVGEKIGSGNYGDGTITVELCLC